MLSGHVLGVRISIIYYFSSVVMVRSGLPRVLLAADGSSAGKTTVSIGIMAVLKEMGLCVQPFKVGLDYIDPGYHSEVTGRVARNLDGYLCDPATIREVFQHGAKGSDISVIEGVRGLFEGLEAESDTGSTAEIAKILECPVVLVVNARSITRSAAAIVKGFVDFDPEVDIRGVILNNLGGGLHREKAVRAVESYTGLHVIGAISRDERMRIGMRHLGLIPAIEGRSRVDGFDASLKSIKSIIKRSVDLEALVRIAESAPEPPRVAPRLYDRDNWCFGETGRGEMGVRIGVALDEAFNFYYRENLELLELAGAEIVYFSPLHDRRMPDVDGLYIGGGYPELFASELEKNKYMREEIRDASDDEMPIFGECGGLMYLSESITTRDRKDGIHQMEEEVEEGTYEMVGALPGNTQLTHKRVVTYTIASFMKDTPIGRKNTTIKAHEFHHSEMLNLPETAEFAIKTERGTGIQERYDGLVNGNTIGTYLHIHAASHPEFATTFVKTCKTRKK
ncbi:Cobyrinate a,c-diamide synthase [Candidatus Methanoperedenaceae archaeon GB37]|nr:Cobyrinate a,c-diamide synthase [Candidatus Methanoperedenaceae archaeon GB37]